MSHRVSLYTVYVTLLQCYSVTVYSLQLRCTVYTYLVTVFTLILFSDFSVNLEPGCAWFTLQLYNFTVTVNSAQYSTVSSFPSLGIS